ncbi:hypothetical protein D6745_04725 [Candidatus Woesearchaeota archaeon]|nr:MAG: hypothetical protein D6745_04725 [Candidatus Woesearchaeota archaeon]
MRRKHIIFALLILAILIAGCTVKEKAIAKPEPVVEEQLKNNSVSSDEGIPIGRSIGFLPHDFTVHTTEGELFNLREQSGKKPVIIYFMATWCPYCAKDFKALSEVINDYENDVVIVAVDVDLNEGINDLKKYKEQYPNLEAVKFAPGTAEILADYKATATTIKYGIGRNGVIIRRGSGAINEAEWVMWLEALINSE